MRVAIVGGSIAGCAMAVAASRCGATEIVIFERSAANLSDRGVGIGMLGDRRDELVAAGYLDPATPHFQITERLWYSDGPQGFGRLFARHPFSFYTHNWGLLWQGLRDQLPDWVEYRAGSPVGRVTRDAVVDGTQFDVVVGADGYKSVVRQAMFAQGQPQEAGYQMWRGTFATDSPLWPVHEGPTTGYQGGHAIAYHIPSSTGKMLVNWGIYVIEGDPLKHLPPIWTEMVERTPAENRLTQTIYDIEVPSYVDGRLILAGDAGAVARPHVTAGAVKAIQDAVAFESAVKGSVNLDEAIRKYGAARTMAGQATVAAGRRLGDGQTVNAPDWTVLDQDSFLNWWGELNQGGAMGGTPLRP